MSLPDQTANNCHYWLLELYKQEVDPVATVLPTVLQNFGTGVQDLYSSMTGGADISTRAVPALIFKMWQEGLLTGGVKPV